MVFQLSLDSGKGGSGFAIEMVIPAGGSCGRWLRVISTLGLLVVGSELCFLAQDMFLCLVFAF